MFIIQVFLLATKSEDRKYSISIKLTDFVSCLGPVVHLLPNNVKLCGFLTFRLLVYMTLLQKLVYMTTVAPETFCAC